MGKLILCVGVSGSGKTTWSKSYIGFSSDVIRISTDECRAICGTDESDQTVSAQVFKSIFLITEHLLNQGKDILIDSTNYNRKSRKEFLDIAKRTNSECHAVVFGVRLPLSEIKERNRKRNRVVPDEVIEKQFMSFQVPTIEEGFKIISNNPS